MHQFSLLAVGLSNIRLLQTFVDDVFFLAKDLDIVKRHCQLNHLAAHQINLVHHQDEYEHWSTQVLKVFQQALQRH